MHWQRFKTDCNEATFVCIAVVTTNIEHVAVFQICLRVSLLLVYVMLERSAGWQMTLHNILGGGPFCAVGGLTLGTVTVGM